MTLESPSYKEGIMEGDVKESSITYNVPLNAFPGPCRSVPNKDCFFDIPPFFHFIPPSLPLIFFVSLYAHHTISIAKGSTMDIYVLPEASQMELPSSPSPALLSKKKNQNATKQESESQPSHPTRPTKIEAASCLSPDSGLCRQSPSTDWPTSFRPSRMSAG
jgi:hypothetical protein